MPKTTQSKQSFSPLVVLMLVTKEIFGIELLTLLSVLPLRFKLVSAMLF